MVWLKALRLKSENPEVRRRVVEKLAGSDNSHDTDLIVASLDDASSLVRCAAVRALETAPEEACIQGLLLALRDESGEVRAAAAGVLGRRGHANLLYPLSSMLSDPCPEAQHAAAKALHQLGWKPSNTAELIRYEIALGIRSASDGAMALTQATEAKQDTTSFLRRPSVEALKGLKDAERIKPLLDALKSEVASARVSAVHGLEHERDELVTTELLKLFADRDANVRLAAAQVVATRPESPPEQFLLFLTDPHFEIRAAAVHYLSRFRHPEIATALTPLLADPDNDVRLGVARALGEIRSASAIEPLVMALADEEQVVRAAAEHALEQIHREWPCSEAARRAALRLKPTLTQRSPWVRSAILQLLDRVGV